MGANGGRRRAGRDKRETWLKYQKVKQNNDILWRIYRRNNSQTAFERYKRAKIIHHRKDGKSEK